LDWSKLSFGERLKRAREGAGLTQEELAAKVGIDQVQISKYEKSRTNPRALRLEPIADAIGDVAYLTWLLTGSGKVPPITKTAPARRPRGGPGDDAEEA
jgi:HTH-type transcriptional regulator, cell division transcriptional repressor